MVLKTTQTLSGERELICDNYRSVLNTVVVGRATKMCFTTTRIHTRK